MFRIESASNRHITFALAIAAAAALSTSTFAQGSSPQGQQQQPPPAQQQQQAQAPSASQTVASADVSDAELEQFAKSLNAVVDINTKLQSDLAGTQDAAKTQELRQQANEKMAAAIKSNGMEVERFNRISRSIKADAELNQRVTAKRRALQNPGQENGAADR